MKNFLRIILLILISISILQVTAFLYGPFFMTEKKWLSLFVSLPSLYFMITSFRFLTAIVGIGYHRYQAPSVFRSKVVFGLNFFSTQLVAKRLFFVIGVNGKEKIVSGLFFTVPSFLIAFKNPLNKVRLLNFGNMMIPFIWLALNGILYSALSYFFPQ